MAGDWIKMQKSLPRDPRVVRISSALKADRLRTVGGLLSAWCLFDEQTEDGKLDGYTPELMDEIVGFQGLARAMESVGWLEIGDGFLAVPRFEEHNGQSAKRRAQDSDRKMSARKADICPQTKRTKSGLEKNREEKSIIPPNPQGGDEDIKELFPPCDGILPQGWKKLSKAEQGRKKVNHNDPMMIRIGKFLSQRETTLWTIAEYLALQDVTPSEDDLVLIGDHYSLVLENNGYRYKDLLTLLNNWPKARTRAEAYFQEFPDHRAA